MFDDIIKPNKKKKTEKTILREPVNSTRTTAKLPKVKGNPGVNPNPKVKKGNGPFSLYLWWS